MSYKIVLWDFNGTIIDDVETGIACVNTMLAKRGLPILRTREEYKRVFGFPVEDYYRRVGFDFDKEPYSVLAHEWVALYRAREAQIPLTEDFITVCAALREKGIAQAVLSSTEQTMLEKQISQYGLTEYFGKIIGTSDIYAGGKIGTAKAVFGTNLRDAVMVGDTVHDAATARAIGAECILFAGGHGRADELRATSFPVIEKMTDLLRYFP